MKIPTKVEKLQCTFPKLTEANQYYVLGLAEGLKRAQNGSSSNSQQKKIPDWGNRQLIIKEPIV